MKLKVEDMFKKAGVDWTTMKPGDSIDIADQNIKVRSHNNKTGEDEFKKILTLVRKEETNTLRILDINKEEVFRASPAHRVWAKDLSGAFQYRTLDEMGKNFISLNDTEYSIEPTNELEPILDFHVEDNENYYANGVLSHNTTPGGKALKFYASIRLEIRKIEFIAKGTDVIGLKSRIKTVKNKTAPPMRKGEFEIIFGKGFQSENEWGEYIVQYDIVKGKPGGSWFDIVNPFTGEEVKVQGKATGVMNYLNDNPDFKEWAINETKKRMFPNQTFEEIIPVMNTEEASKIVDKLVETNESITEAEDIEEVYEEIDKDEIENYGN